MLSSKSMICCMECFIYCIFWMNLIILRVYKPWIFVLFDVMSFAWAWHVSPFGIRMVCIQTVWQTTKTHENEYFLRVSSILLISLLFSDYFNEYNHSRHMNSYVDQIFIWTNITLYWFHIHTKKRKFNKIFINPLLIPFWGISPHFYCCCSPSLNYSAKDPRQSPCHRTKTPRNRIKSSGSRG